MVTANAAENTDLFWASAEAAATSGVVTSFEYRLHPVAEVTGGIVAHSSPPHDVFRSFREFVGSASTNWGSSRRSCTLQTAPASSSRHSPSATPGIAEQAENELAPIVGFGPLISDAGDALSQDQHLLDAAYPAGALNYWKSSFVADLTDEAIDILVDQFAGVPSPMTVVGIESFHGAVTRVGVAETAVPHREPGFNILITSVWSDPGDTEENVEWTRDVYDALRPFLANRRYVGYLSSDDGSAARRLRPEL